jgi:hypothetical protein
VRFALRVYGTEPGMGEYVLMFGVNTEPNDIHVWFKCSSDCSVPSKSRLGGEDGSPRNLFIISCGAIIHSPVARGKTFPTDKYMQTFITEGNWNL